MSEKVMEKIIEAVATPPTRSLMREEPQSTESLLEQTKEATKVLQDTMEENRKLLDKMERFRAEEILKGRSEAGVVIRETEETAAEYAKRILSGRSKR